MNNNNTIINSPEIGITEIKPLDKHDNNWTNINNETLRSWKISLSKASFIYQTIFDKYKKKLDTILILSLIISTICTVLSAISSLSLTTDNKIYVYISLAINILIFILNGSITILNGAMKIYKYDESLTSLSSYLEKIDQLYSTISSELVLPPSLREDAVDFIKREHDAYLTLIKQSPNINTSDHSFALKLYNEYLQNQNTNFKLSQLSNNDEVIEVV